MFIRLMVWDDLPIVTDVYRDANRFAEPQHIRAWTEKSLARHPDMHFVYERDGAVIGAISITHDGVSAQIEDIAVRREYRMHGIGSELLRYGIERVKQRGMKHARLWTHWMSAAAVPFYVRHGFEIVGTHKTSGIEFVPDGESVILLEMNL